MFSSKDSKIFYSINYEFLQKWFKITISAVSALTHGIFTATGFAKTWKNLCKGLSRKCFSTICRPCYQFVAIFSSSINYKVPDSNIKHNLVYLMLVLSKLQPFLTLQFCSLYAAAWIKVILEVFSLAEVTDQFTIFHIWVMISFKSLELLFGTKFATSVFPSVFGF